MKNQIKQALRSFHQTYTVGLTAELEKKRIRARVTNHPLDEAFPYDAEAKLLRQLDLTSKTMLDIGANTGFFSSVMEDIVTPEKLYIFEPIPNLSRYLLKRFKNAQVLNLAISNREGTQTLRLPYINHQLYDTRATLNVNHSEENQTHYDEIEVNLIRLDEFVQKRGIEEIGLVKIDVEGHELELIEGARETFAKFKPLVFIEIEARHHDGDTQKVFKQFTDAGFSGYFMDPLAKTLNPISNFLADRDQSTTNLRERRFHRYHNNFFFVHETKEEAFLKGVDRFLKTERAVA